MWNEPDHQHMRIDYLPASGGAYHLYVYILKSQNFPDRFYVGITSNVEKRIKEHNSEFNKGFTKL